MVMAMTGCSHVRPHPGWTQEGTASWYGEDFHGRPTASGEIYDMHGMSAAHNTLPLGSVVRVTHLGNGRQVVLPINDRGPFVGNRVIDLSYGAARQLSIEKEGLAKVRIEVVQIPRALNERYTLQLGAFTERQNAVALVRKLQDMGYEPVVEEASAQGRQFFRVRIGTYSTMKPAQDLANLFTSRGMSCMVIGL
jgi:rare lipoprotein A